MLDWLFTLVQPLSGVQCNHSMYPGLAHGQTLQPLRQIGLYDVPRPSEKWPGNFIEFKLLLPLPERWQYY